MRAFIKQTIESSLFEQAKVGFIKMGYECVYYKDIPDDLNKEDVVVGYISDIHKAYLKIGVHIPESIDYPQELESFLARKIKKVEYIQLSEDKFPYFIKPVNHKLFPGKVIKEYKDLIGVYDTELYYTEDILNILSEYRVFVQDKEVIGIKHYKGNPFITLNEGIIREMVRVYTTQPDTYALDVGVSCTEGKLNTILVEVNAGYSSGNYGLSEIQYAKFLRDGYLQYL